MAERPRPDRPKNGHHGAPTGAPTEGLYDIPLVGGLIERADRLRAGLPGGGLARQEADLLRLEARALRVAANALEVRARQLERLGAGTAATPRLERVRID